MPAQPPRPGFLFLVCPDVQLLLEHVEDLARRYSPAGEPFKRVCFWGDEAPTNAFWEAVSVRDLFGSMRLVLVRQANLWPAAVWKTLDKLLSKPLTGSWPLFCLENDWDRGKPKIPAAIAKLRSMAFAGKQKWLWQHPGLTDRTVQDYVRAQARARNLSLDQACLQSLCENTPRQAGVLAAELDKLSLLARPGQTMTVGDLGTAEWSPDNEVFDCVSCLMAGDVQGTWREIARTQDMEQAAFPLLGLLAWNFRTLWQLLAGDAPARPGRLTQALAVRLGAARIARGMELVMEAEAAIKTGSPARQVMELTFSRLLGLFARQGGRA